MEMKIEKGVPMNTRNTFANFLRKLDIGDSFILPETKSRSVLAPQAAQVGIKLKTQVDENGQIRVWRIA